MSDAWIFQINVSNGGVPKLAIPSGEVTELGIVGDRQATEKIHGGPERALCLFSLDRVIALQSEGHPIYPGSIGENLTIVGLDWDEIIPGKKLRIGSDVLIEITSYTSPCDAIGDSFKGKKFARVLQDQNPGWSRLYARVLTTGAIRAGDRVRLE